MSQSARRIQERNKAKSTLSELLDRRSLVIIVHYACESFIDKSNTLSPRITSIAVQNLETGQINSFSIHQMAEILGYSSNNIIERHYDELEKIVLDNFYDYVLKHPDHQWLHWKMRDINYGFPAIYHRYKVLAGDPINIHTSQTIDLCRLLTQIYGDNYIEAHKLKRLVEKNGLDQQDYLSGKEEAVAFEKGEYAKLHRSTLKKVNILATIAERAGNGTLKTNATRKQIYGSYLRFVGEIIKENPIIAIIVFISAIISIIAGIYPFLTGG